MKRKLCTIALVIQVAAVVALFISGLGSTVSATAATITPQDVNATSPITPTWTAAVADGYSFANNGRCLLWIENANAATAYITVTTPATYFGFAVADLYVTIPTANRKILGPFSTQLFNDSSGLVAVAIAPTSTISATVIRY